MRELIFQEFAVSDQYGMIFTFMWAFDMQEDWDYVDHVREIFEKNGSTVYYVELVESREVILARDVTENLLRNKASKRDIERSNKRF